MGISFVIDIDIVLGVLSEKGGGGGEGGVYGRGGGGGKRGVVGVVFGCLLMWNCGSCSLVRWFYRWLVDSFDTGR